MTSQVPKKPPTLGERILLRVSESRVVDGFWIGTLPGDNSAVLLQRVEDALNTIRVYDSRRYNRLRQYLQRIWVKVQAGGNTGVYNPTLSACELDPRLLLREGVAPSDIASVIVHEATHARLQRFGFPELLRTRIEAACRKQERAFSEHLPLPEGDKIRDKLKKMDEVREDFWSDATSEQRYKRSVDDALRYVGVPQWLLPLLGLARALSRMISRLRAA